MLVSGNIKVVCLKFTLPSNKALQSDKIAGYAVNFAAERERYVAMKNRPRKLPTSILVVATSIALNGCLAKNSEPNEVQTETKQETTELLQPLTPLQSYILAIQQKIVRNWIKPTEVVAVSDCEVQLIQAPGGLILDVTFTACDENSDEYRSTIERAIFKAEPLPKPSDMALFNRNIYLIFKPD